MNLKSLIRQINKYQQFELISNDDYKDVMKLCKEKIRRPKAQLELNLATAVKDKKKIFS